MNNLAANNDPLAKLNGLALPPAPGWWPPALGWWLLLLGTVLVIGALLWWWRRYQNQAALRARQRAVTAGVQHLQTLAEVGDPRQYATQADHLIRQVARARYGFDGGALSGAAWQKWLADHAPASCDGADWQLLAEARYRKQPPAADLQRLQDHIRRWLEHNSPC